MLLILALMSAHGVAAERANRALLTLDRIFDSSEFDAESYGSMVWRSSGGGYYKLEPPVGGGSGQDLAWFDPETGRKDLYVPAYAFAPPGSSQPLSIEAFAFSEKGAQILLFTNSKRVWRANTRGDYWVFDPTSRELRQLGANAPPASLMFAKFSPDGTRVAFVRDHNLYVQDLLDLRLTALTTNGTAQLINGTFDWVYEEELFLRDGYRWSPDGQSIAYWQLDASGVRDFHLINNVDGLYPSITSIPYPKTGEQNAAARIGVVSAQGGATRWMEVPGDPRNHYLARMDWASNSTELLIQQFNRVQNTNRVFLANARTGQTRCILEETDSAWVENENPVRWLRGGREFLWLSDRAGWQQAYRVSRNGRRTSRVTRARADVIEVLAVDHPGGWLYYLASPDRPAERYLYRVPLSGGAEHQLTPEDQPGTHHYNLSPDARWAIHTYSTFAQPPVIDLIRLPSHESVRTLVDNASLREKLTELNRPVMEFFQIDIGEGILLDGWCLKPSQFDASKKHPVLFHVYGEPAGQTVVDRWLGKGHLWHWMLAQQGYVVVSVDNRGTPAPRGRAWRKALHHQIGLLNTADQAAATRALLEKWPFLDADRVGIWGWSGGGSTTLNALFQHPDLYHLGIAVAAVPNQRLYDTIYQERYMGLPAENPEGYRRGSPITHAHQLQGHLLLVHGTGDDNVHYQGTEALIDELVAHNKVFTMMAYPNRSHGIHEGRNTTRHLYALFTRFLQQHLPVDGQSSLAPPTIPSSRPPEN
jgi:dipeptidyl-peptidase-4